MSLVISLLKLGFALFLVLLNGFFVASEFALVRVRSTSVNQMRENNRPNSKTLQEIMDNLDDYLATTQIGITIASLGLGWVGEPAVADLISTFIAPQIPGLVAHGIAVSLTGFLIITFLHVVYGELASKTIAIQKAEKVSLIVAKPMKFFYYLFIPFIIVFNRSANYSTSLIGIPPASENEEILEEEEILMLINNAEEKGHLDTKEMIHNVFELDDDIVREVMVPTPNVNTVEPEQDLSDVKELVKNEGHTRYPVVEGNNKVIGFIDVKDILTSTESEKVEEIMRDIIIVPETKNASRLLNKLQMENTQIAAIVDEWGNFIGLVTVEDLIEQVIGDIKDKFDSLEKPILKSEGGYVVKGSTNIEMINEEIGLKLETDKKINTIGGYLMDIRGKTPKEGDIIEKSEELEFEIKTVKDNRIEEVIIKTHKKQED